MSFFEVQDPFLKCHKSSLCVAKLKWLLRILDSSVAWDRHWMSCFLPGTGTFFELLLSKTLTEMGIKSSFNALTGLSCYVV